MTVHAYGGSSSRTTPEWARDAVTGSLRHGFDPSVPDRVVDAQLRAIVGMELRITRVEARPALAEQVAGGRLGIIEG